MYPVLAPVSRCYPRYKGRLPTRYSPVRHSTRFPKETFSFDLHVLSTPPAFVLSQDQTLQFDILQPARIGPAVLAKNKNKKLQRPVCLCYSVFKDRGDPGCNTRPGPDSTKAPVKTAQLSLPPICKGETLILLRTAKLSIPFGFSKRPFTTRARKRDNL